MKQNKKRPLSESVRILRWAIVVGIFFVVVTYQFLRELALDFGATEGLTYGILLYGCVGSLVTWVALTWVTSRIAEGERAKQKVMEKEAYIASVVSASADAILTFDAQGILTSWNRGAELIFGYKEEELLGQHFSKLVLDDILGPGELERTQAESRGQGYIRDLETERLTKDGRRITVEVTHTTLKDSDGGVKGYSAVVRDITEKKKAVERQKVAYERIVEAEREIRQMNLELEARITQRTESLELAYQELQKANEELTRVNNQLQELDRMKSEFVSMVSHALRAPVTNINVAIELLARSGASEDDDERKELFQIIEAQSGRLTSLVQGVLTVSRLEGGALELKREAVDMQALCEKTLQNFEATTESHLLRLSCLAHSPYAWADVDCTEEVLTNLLGNAIKYSPAGVHIEVILEERGDCVVTSVVDQGPGIESSELDRIFEIFHRVDGSDSGATGGYGLGLYISKRLIEAQGGTIEAKSTVGKGSTLSFALPAVKKARSPRRGHGTTHEYTDN